MNQDTEALKKCFELLSKLVRSESRMSADKNKRKDLTKAPHTHFYFITLFQFNKEIF